MKQPKGKPKLLINVKEITNLCGVKINFSEPILLPPGFSEFVPSNLISNLYLSIWDEENQ